MPNSQRSCDGAYAANCGSTPGRKMPLLTLSSPAKLNIFLEVLGKRSDGYHELETVMLRTSFCDQLTFQQTNSSEITLRFSDATTTEMRGCIPLDETNLIAKAARAIQRLSGTQSGADIILHKRIPPESGLGGGSSNAASTLLGCRQLWNAAISDEQLHSIAASLGSDINFLLTGSAAAVCRGRGELITGIPLAGKLHFVALRPRSGNSTAAIFRQTQISSTPRSSKALADAVIGGSGNLPTLIFNRLTSAAANVNPAMSLLLKRIPQIIHRPVFMSGSGSTVFVVATSRPDAKSVSDRLRQACRLPVWILECG
ncbi:MAG: 4-(cytidine 5'-diphospho)-2-C-methyl-D-erythritol kinase [Planctomycetota bacterium]|nr:4-(cytidine 5'-diphospho)-2-C-methyl-D-erythritol kinase [Planctomycetota bacterium]